MGSWETDHSRALDAMLAVWNEYHRHDDVWTATVNKGLAVVFSLRLASYYDPQAATIEGSVLMGPVTATSSH